LKLKEANLAGDLKIEGAPGLDWLELSGNRLTSIEFKNMPKLGGFKITDKYLLSMTLAGGLGCLNWGCEIDAEKLINLQVKGRNNLSELYIKASRLEELEPFRRLKDLFVLKIKSDRLVDLGPLAGCRFPDLALESPLLGDLRPLALLKKPQELFISGGMITDFSPLAELRSSLYALDISSPLLIDIQPLARLEKLSILGIFSDSVTDLSPLAGLKHLNDLVLEGKEMRDFSPIAALEDNLSWEIINGRQLKGDKREEKIVEQTPAGIISIDK
jgi:Leucine-rich repeat (LRR) protein